MFFFLLQTEQGDIFKVTLESEDDVVGGVLSLFSPVVIGSILLAGDRIKDKVF